MNKSKVIAALVTELRDQYERTLAAVKEAADGATGDDTKAESKYDTRGLESSYLAAGQIEQADRLARELSEVEGYEFPDFDERSSIDVGALIEGKLKDGKIFYYLIAPAGGGTSIEFEGQTIMTVGPAAPLAGHLLEKTVGDSIDHPPLTVISIK